MQINNLYEQKQSLAKAYIKNYDELFSQYLKKTKDSTQKDASSLQNLADNFYKAQKILRGNYDAMNYKLDISQTPNDHTMTAAVNRNQSLLIDEMNEQIANERKKLKDKLASGKYNMLEELKMNKELKSFELDLRQKVSQKIKDFRDSYQEALDDKDISRINTLQNSLLSDLLAKI